MPVCIRGRSAYFNAWAATSMSFFNGTAQCTNRGFLITFEIWLTDSKSPGRNRKTGFDDINAQVFQFQRRTHFFCRIQFTTGHLFAIA